MTCQSTINIKDERYHAGVLVSHLPDRIPIYAKEDEHCDISLGVPPSHLIMFYFVHLDFISSDLFLCDSANIELFDGSPGNYVKGNFLVCFFVNNKQLCIQLLFIFSLLDNVCK